MNDRIKTNGGRGYIQHNSNNGQGGLVEAKKLAAEVAEFFGAPAHSMRDIIKRRLELATPKYR